MTDHSERNDNLRELLYKPGVLDKVAERVNKETLGRRVAKYVGFTLFALFILALIVWPLFVDKW